VNEIKRTGPPVARDVRGKAYIWTLPLNRMPDRMWKQFFGQRKDVSIVCHPWKVTIYQGHMIFESSEDDIVNWIKFIDAWMAGANERWLEWDAHERRRRGEEAPDTRDRDVRLSEVNEKFKNL